MDAGAEPPAEPTIQPALRATREYAHFLACQKVTMERLKEVASIFGASIEGMRAQLTPARAQALVHDAHREAELQGLIADAKTELTKLKKVNRELEGELRKLSGLRQLPISYVLQFATLRELCRGLRQKVAEHQDGQRVEFR